MIHEIPTLEKAAEIMEQAYLTPWSFTSIIFDLDGTIEPNEICTRISRCLLCDLTIWQNLSEYLDKCPHCLDDHLRVLVEVMLVVQGSVVIHTAWREV